MLLLQFGFAGKSNASDLVKHSPLSWGYIAISQRDRDSRVIYSRYDLMHLVASLSELMSGLIAFFSNDRTKHYSFSCAERDFDIQLDRRKRSMMFLQINDTDGLYSESAVLAAFQEAMIHFVKEEYSILEVTTEADDLTEIERDLDRWFRQSCIDFLALRAEQ